MLHVVLCVGYLFCAANNTEEAVGRTSCEVRLPATPAAAAAPTPSLHGRNRDKTVKQHKKMVCFLGRWLLCDVGVRCAVQ